MDLSQLYQQKNDRRGGGCDLGPIYVFFPQDAGLSPVLSPPNTSKAGRACPEASNRA